MGKYSKHPILSPIWFKKKRKPSNIVILGTSREGIDQCTCGDPQHCAIATNIMLVLGIGPRDVHVDANGIRITWRLTQQHYRFKTPMAALQDLRILDETAERLRPVYGSEMAETMAKAQMEPAFYALELQKIDPRIEKTPEKRAKDNAERSQQKVAVSRNRKIKRYTGVVFRPKEKEVRV